MPEKKKKREREMRTSNIRLTTNAHRLLSMLAAAMGLSISETVETVIHEKYPDIAQSAQAVEYKGADESVDKEDK